MGPIHYAVVGFSHPTFHGELASELSTLVDLGVISILDIVFVHKNVDGDVAVVEVDAVDEAQAAFEDLDGAYGGLLSDTDLDLVSADLPHDTAAAIVVWENLWEAKLADAMAAAGGSVIDAGVIPADTIEPALASLTS